MDFHVGSNCLYDMEKPYFYAYIFWDFMVSSWNYLKKEKRVSISEEKRSS